MEEKEETFKVHGNDSQNANIWSSSQLWLCAEVENSYGTEINKYFRIPLILGMDKLTKKERVNFIFWLVLINRYCQRTLLNVVFWPLKHVGFRPSKMLVFGP
ncbi:hypothetical protein [Enterococcus devriesei]|uniref:hypothetical protein n=1 Tax=Enterococcus devriesei TaxID=319970 RepID=UPI0036D31BD4